MSSKFNPSTTKRNHPPWCKPGMFPTVPPLIDGKPSFIVAYLAMKDLPTADPVDVTAAIRLPLVGDGSTYEGVSAQAKHHLGAQVIVDLATNTAFMEVQLWKEGDQTESEEFEDVPVGRLPNWRSALQIAIFVPGQDHWKIQVWS